MSELSHDGRGVSSDGRSSPLLEGDALEAERWCSTQIEITLERHGASTPDPVEWAYAIVIALCRGQERRALEYASRFPHLRHPELDRARDLAAMAAGCDPHDITRLTGCKYQYSVHQCPRKESQERITDVCKMLSACGQSRMVDRITAAMGTRKTFDLGDKERDDLYADRKARPVRRSASGVGRSLPSLRSYLRQVGKRYCI